MERWYLGRRASLSRVCVLSIVKNCGGFYVHFMLHPPLLRVFDTRHIVPHEIQRLMGRRQLLIFSIYLLEQSSS